MNNYVNDLLQEIFSEAAHGIIRIGDKNSKEGEWVFYARFFYKIHDSSNATSSKYPVFEIPDVETFVSKVESYLEKARTFYKKDSSYFGLTGKNFDKKLVFDLLMNASVEDFSNVFGYLDCRTEMLTTPVETKKRFLGYFLGYKMYGETIKNHSNLETPYRFNFYIADDLNNKFNLPSVFFGNTKNECYIMAIQNLYTKQENQLKKKLDRYFRKANKNVPADDIISKVSPNALVSLTAFLTYQQKLGMSTFYASGYQPIRYHGGEVAGLVKAKSTDEKKGFIKKHESDQFNITNKLMYSFLRYSYHFPSSTTEYDDNTQRIKLSLNPTSKIEDENVLNLLSNSIKINREQEHERTF